MLGMAEISRDIMVLRARIELENPYGRRILRFAEPKSGKDVVSLAREQA